MSFHFTTLFVILQVELLTPSQRVQLLSSGPMAQLDPLSCEERIISHEVKEMGEHRCAVAKAACIVESDSY